MPAQVRILSTTIIFISFSSCVYMTLEAYTSCNRSHNVSLPIILKKIKVGQILQFSVSPYFVILDSGFCFIKCTALFWGQNGHFLY